MILLSRTYKNGVPGPGHLFIEGIVAICAASTFALQLFPTEASLVSVCLATISTIDSLERVLSWNRSMIIDQGASPTRVNARLVGLILSLFLGAAVAYAGLALVLDPSAYHSLFSHQLHEVPMQEAGNWELGGLGSLLLHNLYVLSFFFLVAVAFRQGGVMMTVAWNASVWGATAGVLSRTLIADGGIAWAEATGWVVAVLAPHLVAEAAAYTLAGFAGVFLSKGMLRYTLEGRGPWLSLLRTVAAMLATAVGLIALGALWESQTSAMLLDWLGQRLGGRNP